MNRRRVLSAVAWAVVTGTGIAWLALGNLTSEFGPAVLMLVAVSLGFGPAKAIAWWRLDREDPLLPRMLPLRISGVVGLVLAFGPALASMAGWIDILLAAFCFFGTFIAFSICAALFSDGYQGFWLDSLIFRGRLSPPEDDYLDIRDANRRQGK